MKAAVYKITLDILESQSRYSLPMKKGETSREIHITLREGGVPYEIGKDCFAVFSGRKPDGNPLENNCVIKENTIIYAITGQTTSVSGLVDCEINLYGADEGLICSARFSIIVDKRVTSDKEIESTSEFSALTELYNNEVARKGAEELREVAEDAREFAEAGRVDAETIRALSEDERKASEETRNQNFEQIKTEGTAGIEALGQATKNANNIVANIQQKLDNGDFVGEKGEKGDKGDTPAIDQVYNPTSKNAQSGVAVEEAIGKVDEKVETLNNGGLILKEDFIGEQVSEWLDEHPEATTTVQDSSLEEVKFTKSLKQKTIKDYVTPEMFGAVGDGITDDTIAVQNCINTAGADNKTVKLISQYYISSSITVEKAVKIEGTGTINKVTKSGCGFLHDTTALIVQNASSLSAYATQIKNVLFKQVSETSNINAVLITNGTLSCMSICDCDFINVTGYAIKFFETYSQMIEIRNLSCWNCGGVIGASSEEAVEHNAGTPGICVTCATLDNINLDDGVNQTSPQDPIMDLTGFREFTVSNIVLEGANGNFGSVGVKISNNRWNNLNGCHIEFKDGFPSYAIEVSQSYRLMQEDGTPKSKNGTVTLHGVTAPILLSATQTNLYVYGLYAFQSTSPFTVTGESSTVIVDAMMIEAPEYNMFNLDALGKIKYLDFSTTGGNTTETLPVTFNQPVTIFEWNAKKGTLYDSATKEYFENDYYKLLIPAKASWDLDNSGLVYDDELGYVYRIISAQGLMASFHMNFVGDTQKNALLGKRVTLSITYRAKTNGGTVPIIASAVKGGYGGASFINNGISDEVAIGVTSILVNEANTGFVISGVKNDDGNKYMDIIGIKISIGDEVEGMPLVFSV